MAKKAFVYDGSQWVDIAQSTADLSTYQKSNRTGLNVVVPTGATNGTVGANGAVTIGNAVSTVTVSGAFSATYDNYRILISGGSNTTGANNLDLRLGANAGGWAYTFVYTSYGSGTVSAAGNANNTKCDYVGIADPGGLAADISLVNPFLAKWTLLSASSPRSDLGGHTTGVHKATTSYSDFTIGCALGSMTGGTIRIYGYNNN